MSSSRLLFVLLLSLLCLSSLPLITAEGDGTPASPTIVYLSPTGNDGFTGLSESQSVSSLKGLMLALDRNAETSSVQHFTVRVANGLYSNNNNGFINTGLSVPARVRTLNFEAYQPIGDGVAAFSANSYASVAGGMAAAADDLGVINGVVDQAVSVANPIRVWFDGANSNTSFALTRDQQIALNTPYDHTVAYQPNTYQQQSFFLSFKAATNSASVSDQSVSVSVKGIGFRNFNYRLFQTTLPSETATAPLIDLTLTNTVFALCKPVGALFPANVIRSLVANNIFVFRINNAYSGEDGSFLAGKRITKLAITNSVFQLSSALFNGGVIAIDNTDLSTSTQVVISITGSSFASNSLTSSSSLTLVKGGGFGGALSFIGVSSTSANSLFVISGSTFDANTALISNGAAVGVQSSTQKLVITSSVFSNNQALSGGAVAVLDASVDIGVGTLAEQATPAATTDARHTRFLNNVAVGAPLQSERTDTCYGFVTGVGGAVFVRSSAATPVLTLGSVSFTGNQANLGGGAVFARSARFISTEGTMFTSNGISPATSNGNGGALFLCSNSVETTITGAVFSQNTVTLGGGAAAYLSSQRVRTVAITSSTFDSNKATGATSFGGALMIFSSSGVKLNALVFRNNEAGLGAALDVATASNVAVAGLTCQRNKATYAGGCINVHDSAILTLTGSVAAPVLISQNSAAQFGGSMYISSRSTVLADTITIQDNVASKDGGAAYVTSSANLQITGCTVTGNSASRDGGAFLILSQSKFNSIRSTLKANSAKNNGGVVSVDSSSVTFDTTRAEANVATRNGGVFVVANRGSVSVANSDLIANVASTGNGGVFYGSGKLRMESSRANYNVASRGHGGALFLNTATDVQVKTSDLMYNVAFKNGGAIYAIELSSSVENVIADGVRISSNNVLTGFGGGVYVDNCKLTFVNTVLFNNSASNELSPSVNGGSLIGSGGALFGGKRANIVLSAPTLEANTAPIAGGAVFLTSTSTLTVNQATFLSNVAGAKAATALNTAMGVGGAIYAEANSVLSIRQTTFNKNTAGVEAGAVFAGLGVESTVVDSKFTNNAAGGDGGAFITDQGVLSLSGTEFTSNQAGAVVVGSLVPVTYTSQQIASDPTLQLPRVLKNGAGGGGAVVARNYARLTATSNTLFNSNKAASAGGALKLDVSSKLDLSKSSFQSNNALLSGGAIYVSDAYKWSKVYTVASTLCNDWRSSFAMAQVDFKANTANLGGGGAIFLEYLADDCLTQDVNKTAVTTKMMDVTATYAAAFAHPELFSVNLVAKPTFSPFDLFCYKCTKTLNNATYGPDVATGLRYPQYNPEVFLPTYAKEFPFTIRLLDSFRNLVLGYDNVGFTVQVSMQRIAPADGGWDMLTLNGVPEGIEYDPTNTDPLLQFTISTMEATDTAAAGSLNQAVKLVAKDPITNHTTTAITVNNYMSAVYNAIDFEFNRIYFTGVLLAPYTMTSTVYDRSNVRINSNRIGVVLNRCGLGQERLSSGQCSGCPVNTFNLNYDGNCYPCPAEAKCPDPASVNSAMNYWRDPAVKDDVLHLYGSSAFHRCLSGECCPDGGLQPDGRYIGCPMQKQCVNGRSGMLCNTCPNGLASGLDGECLTCNDTSSLTTVAVIVLFFIPLVCLLFPPSFSVSFVLLITFLQLLPLVVRSDMGFFTPLQFFNFDLFTSTASPSACFYTLSPLNAIAVRFGMIMATWAWLGVLFVLTVLIAKFNLQSIVPYFGKLINDYDKLYLQSFRHAVTRMYMLTFIPVIKVCLDFVGCRAVDSTYLLRSAPSVECWTGSHWGWAVFSIVIIALFICLPAMYITYYTFVNFMIIKPKASPRALHIQAVLERRKKKEAKEWERRQELRKEELQKKASMSPTDALIPDLVQPPPALTSSGVEVSASRIDIGLELGEDGLLAMDLVHHPAQVKGLKAKWEQQHGIKRDEPEPVEFDANTHHDEIVLAQAQMGTSRVQNKNDSVDMTGISVDSSPSSPRNGEDGSAGDWAAASMQIVADNKQAAVFAPSSDKLSSTLSAEDKAKHLSEVRAAVASGVKQPESLSTTLSRSSVWGHLNNLPRVALPDGTIPPPPAKTLQSRRRHKCRPSDMAIDEDLGIVTPAISKPRGSTRLQGQTEDPDSIYREEMEMEKAQAPKSALIRLLYTPAIQNRIASQQKQLMESVTSRRQALANSDNSKTAMRDLQVEVEKKEKMDGSDLRQAIQSLQTDPSEFHKVHPALHQGNEMQRFLVKNNLLWWEYLGVGNYRDVAFVFITFFVRFIVVFLSLFMLDDFYRCVSLIVVLALSLWFQRNIFTLPRDNLIWFIMTSLLIGVCTLELWSLEDANRAEDSSRRAELIMVLVLWGLIIVYEAWSRLSARSQLKAQREQQFIQRKQLLQSLPLPPVQSDDDAEFLNTLAAIRAEVEVEIKKLRDEAAKAGVDLDSPELNARYADASSSKMTEDQWWSVDNYMYELADTRRPINIERMQAKIRALKSKRKAIAAQRKPTWDAVLRKRVSAAVKQAADKYEPEVLTSERKQGGQMMFVEEKQQEVIAADQIQIGIAPLAGSAGRQLFADVDAGAVVVSTDDNEAPAQSMKFFNPDDVNKILPKTEASIVKESAAKQRRRGSRLHDGRDSPSHSKSRSRSRSRSAVSQHRDDVAHSSQGILATPGSRALIDEEEHTYQVPVSGREDSSRANNERERSLSRSRSHRRPSQMSPALERKSSRSNVSRDKYTGIHTFSTDDASSSSAAATSAASSSTSGPAVPAHAVDLTQIREEDDDRDTTKPKVVSP